MIKKVIKEFEFNRDPKEALGKLQKCNTEDTRQLTAKLKLINILQTQLVEQLEDVNLAKNLLARLDLYNENIIFVMRQLNLSQVYELGSVLDDLEDELFDECITLAQQKQNDEQSEKKHQKSVTLDKLFQHALPYAREEEQKYTTELIELFVEYLTLQNWNSAFNLLLRIEPDIPKNLQVPRMHQPLLQKYLWKALNGFEHLFNLQQEERALTLQEMQNYLNLKKYAFDLSHAQLLKEQLSNL